MILYHLAPWKNTITLRLTFDLNGLDIHRTHPGLLHFAEHLSFVATKKYNHHALGDAFSLYFDLLRATTSVSRLSYTIRCHSADLPKVTEILHEMIYEWKCPRAFFDSEKKILLDEYKNDYEHLPFTKNVLHLSTTIPALKYRGIGNKKALQKLTYADVRRAKILWQSVINQAPCALVVVSGALTSQQKQLLTKLVDATKQPTLNPPHTVVRAEIIETEQVSAIRFPTYISSPFFLTLQRIYYVRGEMQGSPWYIDKIWERGQHIFFVERPDKTVKSKQRALAMLTELPTKAEFTEAQLIIAKHFGTLADAVDSANLVDWLQDFWLDSIAPLQHTTLAEIANIFKKYSYTTFKNDWWASFEHTKK